MGRAIAILGAKGGVGTTTVACNLAAQLHADGAGRVLLVDLHLFLGDIGYRLGLEQRPTVGELLASEAPDWTQAPQHRFGFHVLGLDSDLAHADHVSAEDVVDLLSGCRAGFDVVLLDCGAEVTEASLAACRYADFVPRAGANRSESGEFQDRTFWMWMSCQKSPLFRPP